MNKNEVQQLLKGRSPEQQKAIKYLCAEGGCMSKGLTDEEYEAMVMGRVKSFDSKNKALKKIGLDESQVTEIDPVHFEGYVMEGKKQILMRVGKDKRVRTSCFQITWLFFTSTQLYAYQYTFNMDNDEKKESTEEYFYKDVTNFSSLSDTVETYLPEVKGCMKNEVVWNRKNVESNQFAIVVPGEKFKCAMEQNDYSEKVIQAMKAKLREKKG